MLAVEAERAQLAVMPNSRDCSAEGGGLFTTLLLLGKELVSIKTH